MQLSPLTRCLLHCINVSLCLICFLTAFLPPYLSLHVSLFNALLKRSYIFSKYGLNVSSAASHCTLMCTHGCRGLIVTKTWLYIQPLATNGLGRLWWNKVLSHSGTCVTRHEAANVFGNWFPADTQVAACERWPVSATQGSISSEASHRETHAWDGR